MTSLAAAENRPFTSRAFLIAMAANTLWINASEVFRYFVFVMPMMRAAFPELHAVAPMDLGVFALWGLWDMILVLIVTGAAWVYLDRAGDTALNALTVATTLWAGIFVILWLGLYNMNLATLEILAIALPLAWIELAVASALALWARRSLSR